MRELMKISGRNSRPVDNRQRGAALILTIVVILVLSTVGLAMVNFTENEENTAASYRDQIQAQTLAEAGARVAVQMFRSPADRRLIPLYAAQGSASGSTPPAYDYYGLNQADMETSLNALGIYRRQRAGAGTTLYTGSNNRLFLGPFHTSWDRTFGGTYTDPGNDFFDVSFRRSAPGSTTVIANNWLDTRINSMITAPGNWNETVGRISEISFYGPPVAGTQSYAYATARVTAEKVDANGRVIARETVEAIIGDEALRPSILTNGNLKIESSSTFCGGACEQIHANGNIAVQSSSQINGGNPALSAQGTITTNSGVNINPPAQQNQDPVPPPMINPWDLLYKPTSNTLLDRYYLITNRIPAAVWTDDNAGTNTPDYPCTNGGGMCQDYGLEYNPSTGAVQAKGTQSRMYRWDRLNQNWDLISGPVGNNGVHMVGLAFFRYRDAADQAARTTDFSQPAKNVADDTARIPFNKARVGYAYWEIFDVAVPAATAAIQNTVFLVDGNLEIQSSAGGNRTSGSPAWRTSLIVVGGFRLGSSSNIDPALENRVMILAGRDIQFESSFNNDFSGTPQGFCTSPTYNNAPGTAEHLAASGVIAAHEQLYIGSSAKVLGILIAENQQNLHDNRTSGFRVFEMYGATNAGNAMFIQSSSNHAYLCDQPPWPFPTQGNAIALALNSAGR